MLTGNLPDNRVLDKNIPRQSIDLFEGGEKKAYINNIGENIGVIIMG
jgi:hypothetical protein